MTTISETATRLLSLEGKVAIVTGAGSGIGRGIALRLAQMGAALMVLDIDPEGGEATARSITERGGRALFEKCDVRHAAATATRQPRKPWRSFGRIDILCNNAGVIVRKNVVALSEEEWDLALDVTLKGIFPAIARGDPAHGEERGRRHREHRLRLGAERRAAGCFLLRSEGGSVESDQSHGHRPREIEYPGELRLPRRHRHSDAAQRMRAARRGSRVLYERSRARPLGARGKPGGCRGRRPFPGEQYGRWITGTQLVVDGGGLA